MVTKSKAHLVFPEELLQAIDKLVGKRGRSKFVGEATRKELKRIQLQKALEKAAGAWKDEDHPETKQKGTYRWVRDLREEAEERFKEILH
jgi:metal-responsive CopG/Arc/MetJ family transcriptional regulator